MHGCLKWHNVTQIILAKNKSTVVDCDLNMSGYSHHVKLTRLSAQLDELFSQVSACGSREALPPELADEIAATAGEVMVELAEHRGELLARSVIEDARRLRDVVRTLRPEAKEVADAGQTLTIDLQLVIRQDKSAA